MSLSRRLFYNVYVTNGNLTADTISTNSTVTNSVMTGMTVSNLRSTSISSTTVDVSGISSQFAGSFAAANNVMSPTDITGFFLSNSVFGSFTSIVNVKLVTLTENLNAQYYIEGTQTTSGWVCIVSILGDDVDINFGITSLGQVQYTSPNKTGWISTTINYQVTGIKLSTDYSTFTPTSGNAVVSGILNILGTMDANSASSASLAVSGGVSIIKNVFVGGNVGLGTTSPGATLDVTGTARITTSLTTGSVNATNSTVTNVVTTNISSSTLRVSHITSGNIIPQANVTYDLGSTSARWRDIYLSTSTIKFEDGTELSTSSGNLQITDSNTGKYTRLGGDEVSSGNLVALNAQVTNFVATTGISTNNIISTRITTGTIVATTYTGGSMSLSGDLKIAGTLTTVNITTTNIIDTNISAGILNASNASITNMTSSTARITTGMTTGAINVTGRSILSDVTASNITSGLMKICYGAGGLIVPLVVSNDNVNYGSSQGIDIGQGNQWTRMYDTNVDAFKNRFIMEMTCQNSTYTNLLCALNDQNNIYVGIGTTSPSYRFDVNGNIRVSTSSGNAVGQITNSASGGYASFTMTNDLRDWYVGAGGSSTGVGTADKFYIGNSFNTNIITATSGGNVGIGTYIPSYRLQVDSGSRTDGNLMMTNTIGGGVIAFGDTHHTIWGRRGYDGAIDKMQFREYGQIEFWTGGAIGSQTQRMIVSSNGNVGIGINTPLSSLHLASNNNTSSNILFEPGTTTDGDVGNRGWSAINFNGYYSFAEQRINTNKNRWRIVVDQRNTTDEMHFETYNGSNNIQLLTFTSGANVGIGTYSPRAKLEITQSSSTTGMMLYSGLNDGGINSIIFNHSGNTSTYQKVAIQTQALGGGQGARANLALCVNTLNDNTNVTMSDAKLFIHGSSGNVGIGTNSPSYKLDVNGTIARSGVRLPRFDNGTFSGANTAYIPILFSDVNYNYAELKIKYTVTTLTQVMLIGIDTGSNSMLMNETALKTEKWNNTTPYYDTASGVYEAWLARDVEQLGLVNNLTFRITRSGNSGNDVRNHYSFDNVYCWSGIGSSRGYGQGHIDTSGGRAIAYIVLACNSGNINGTYSTVHYY